MTDELLHVPASEPNRSGARVSSGPDSKQDYATPWPLIRAIENMLGERFEVDLAASPENHKAEIYVTENENSLLVPWHQRFGSRLCWLNPPFSLCTEFSEKCHREWVVSHGAWRGVMLTPASVDSLWWNEHVHHVARVLWPRPRIKFIGAKDPFPKPCALSFYNINLPRQKFTGEHWHYPWKWNEILPTMRNLL